jgi:NAD(P)H-flavin reductase
MSDWHEAPVSSVRSAADGLFHLQLDVSQTALAGAHALPGQFVKLSLEGQGEGFFAIASAPHPRGVILDFLIKRGSPLADTLAALPPGSRVRLTSPSGKGFPLEKARNRSLLLFATGSGISPIRSVIEVIRRERTSFKDVTLYFGARTPDAFAYAEEMAHWQEASIEVIRTVSQPGASGWQGLTGYVQTHVGEKDVTGALAFLCGQKAMVQAVTDLLVQRGLPREDIYLNF